MTVLLSCRADYSLQAQVIKWAKMWRNNKQRVRAIKRVSRARNNLSRSCLKVQQKTKTRKTFHTGSFSPKTKSSSAKREISNTVTDGLKICWQVRIIFSHLKTSAWATLTVIVTQWRNISHWLTSTQTVSWYLLWKMKTPSKVVRRQREC